MNVLIIWGVLLLASSTFVQPQESLPLAEEIASKDLAVTNQEQFDKKFDSFIAQAKGTLRLPISSVTHRQALQLYDRFTALLTVYQNRYLKNDDKLNRAHNLLNELSSKFKLTSPIPYLIPIKIINLPLRVGTSDIADFFTFALADTKRPWTQTEAYLSRPDLRNLVRGTITTGVYNSLFASALEQERKYRDHYVFYHGQNKNFILFYDVLTEIFKILSGQTSTSDFKYIRIPDPNTYNKTLADLLQKGFDTDYEGHIRKLLLSVNLSLFGNSSNSGESSLDYFISSSSAHPPSDIIDLLIYEFDINPKYIGDFKRIFNNYALQSGNLLQILIPKDKVNDYAYLSEPFGEKLSRPPYNLKIDLIDAKGVKHSYLPEEIDIKTYLDIYRNYPEALNYFAMDLIQARLLITNDFLLNPKSGVKMFSYDTASSQDRARYKKELRVLIREALGERAKALLFENNMPSADKEMFQAVRENRMSALIKALQHGAHIDTRNYYGQTVRDIAVGKMDFRMKRFLIDVSYRRFSINTLLDYIKEGNIEEAKYFLSIKPALINTQGGQDNNTPLIAAVQYDRASLVKLLLHLGAHIHITNREGKTALQIAKEQNNHYVVKLLMTGIQPKSH